MKRAAVVAMLAVGSPIMARFRHAQGPSVEPGITTFRRSSRRRAGLGVQPSLAFRPDNDEAIAAINVDDSKVYQRMEAGAAFTDGTAWLVKNCRGQSGLRD